MKSKAYWKERFVQLEQGQFYTAMGEYGKIETFFNQAQKELQDEIELWYSRLANNNGVSMSEAKKLLKGKKLKEFKWDVEQYIQYGKDNALNGQWLKELENASARYHISHLEALKIRTKQAIEKCYHNYGLTATNAVGNSYTSALYKTAYTIQRGFGIGADIAGVDERKLEKLISKPWAADGKNFSERIWDNKEKLVNDLHQSLSRNIMTSGDPKLVIDDLAKKMNTSKTNAGRLIMTENAYFSSLAEKDELHDLGIEEYEIVATLDERTSDICQGMDGMVFKVSEFEPGVNAPPFHVNCRSTTVPHFNENFDLGERAARDKDGKTIKVPADMKYPEWKNKFIVSNNENNSQGLIVKNDEIGKKLNSIGFSEVQSEYISNTLSNLPDGTREKEIWYDAFDNAPFDVVEEEVNTCFNTITGKIQFSSVYDEPRTAFHEVSHWKDVNAVEKIAWEGKSYQRTLNDASEYVQFLLTERNGEIPYISDFSTFCKTIGMEFETDGKYHIWFKEEDNAFKAFNDWVKTKLKPKYKIEFDDDKGFSSVSDILSGLTSNQIHSDLLWGGHSQSYWFQNVNLFYKEAWADFCTLKVTRNEPMLLLLKDLTPNLYSYLDETYNEVFEVGKKSLKKTIPSKASGLKKGVLSGKIKKTPLQKLKRSSDFLTIKLPKQEYAQVMSELNTNLSREQRAQKIITKCIGDYVYTVENNGFDDYRIIGRKPIKGTFADLWSDNNE